LHQVGTSSLLIYMMHGHTYIKYTHVLYAIHAVHALTSNIYIPTYVHCDNSFMIYINSYRFRHRGVILTESL